MPVWIAYAGQRLYISSLVLVTKKFIFIQETQTIDIHCLDLVTWTWTQMWVLSTFPWHLWWGHFQSKLYLLYLLNLAVVINGLLQGLKISKCCPVLDYWETFLQNAFVNSWVRYFLSKSVGFFSIFQRNGKYFQCSHVDRIFVNNKTDMVKSGYLNRSSFNAFGLSINWLELIYTSIFRKSSSIHNLAPATSACLCRSRLPFLCCSLSVATS